MNLIMIIIIIVLVWTIWKIKSFIANFKLTSIKNEENQKHLSRKDHMDIKDADYEEIE